MIERRHENSGQFITLVAAANGRRQDPESGTIGLLTADPGMAAHFLPGHILAQGFRVLFEPMDRDEQLADAEAAAGLDAMRELVDHETRTALRVVKGRDGVIGEDGALVSFGADLLRHP